MSETPSRADTGEAAARPGAGTSDVAQRRAVRAIAWVLAIYVALVATHEGEFWPFTIYPMFSRTGQPWTRAVVRDVSGVSPEALWETTGFKDLPGLPITLPEYGVDHIDHTNYVVKTKVWDEDRVQGLRDLYEESTLQGKRWMVMKVTGRLSGREEEPVSLEAVPFLLLTGDDTLRNPELPGSAYGGG